MRFATFNIYWLGGNKVHRSEQDEAKIGRIITKLDADVIAFQEILEASALLRVIERVNLQTGRKYSLKDQHGNWLASGEHGMRVMMAYDIGTTELITSAAIAGGVGRRPCALHLVELASGTAITVIGVHFQSGYPYFDDADDADIRRLQCKNLAEWLSGEQQVQNPQFPKPSTENVVVLGDFNAINDLDVTEVTFEVKYPEVSYESLAPLRVGTMANWHWPQPLADGASGRYSVYGERLMIDFIMFSPSLSEHISGPPRVYAFDQDHEIGGSGIALSDHRPVVAELSW